MKKTVAATDPDACVAGLAGWQRDLVQQLRPLARAPKGVVEAVKWGHLVYARNGPAYLIRAEESRVLFGFWRGQRLRAIEPRLKPGGKYEMATIELREGDTIAAAVVRKLVAGALELDAALGDPTDAAPARKPRK